ncbi:MAG: hypothetical protein QM496_17585 [Verrucomicrobiota bacterium]
MQSAPKKPYRRILSFLILSTTLFCHSLQAEEWKRINSKDGNISALFPKGIQDKAQTQIDKTPAGKVKSTFGEYYGNGILIAGSAADLPRLARAAGHKNIFNGSKKTFLDQAKGTELSFTKTTVDDVPAWSLTYKGAAYRGKGEPYQGQALFVIVDKRIYIFNAVTTKPSTENQALEKKLFTSIKVIKK